jgi:hypothetical protein
MSSSHEAETKSANQNPNVSPVVGQMATAAVFGELSQRPKANLYLAIGNAPRDPDTGVIEPTSEQRSEITRALSEFEGIMPSSTYGQEDVSQGVKRAQNLVEVAESDAFLSSLRMLESPQEAIKEVRPLRISMQGDLAIDPRRIIGTAGLRDWAGLSRNSDGTPFTKTEGGNKGESRPSYELIEDYATRDAQLPVVSSADVFLTREGMFAYAHNSHRVAAAQLRHEPVRVDEVHLYDYRNRDASMLAQTELHLGTLVANKNSQVE